MKLRKNGLGQLFVSFTFLVVAVFLGGCSYQIVPSQYDLKLKTKTTALTASIGGESAELILTIDSRRYQDLLSDQGIFLSYHILSEEGEMLKFDNPRTELTPVAARGVEKERLVYTAPVEAGSYLLQIDLVEEGVTWFSEQGMPTLEIPLTVEETYEPPCHSTIIETAESDLQVISGENTEIPVTIRNNGAMPIYAKGDMATKLSYHLTDEHGTMLEFDGPRTELLEDIPAGKSCETMLKLDESSSVLPGNYQLQVDLVIENSTWYTEQGMTVLEIPFVVPKH